MILFLIACISENISFKEYDISIQISNPSPDASHNAMLLHEWVGEGILRYPMYPLEEIYFNGDTLDSWTVLVRQDQGEGLALFVWEDIDGDEIHCGIDKEEERSKLVILDETTLNISTTIELAESCLGFERQYDILEE
ncbi:MAG: hypothetical protein CMK59_13450 [Proteobacteria bacterium]|nr:hypothetical protein [Pseudomonadota bacterium]